MKQLKQLNAVLLFFFLISGSIFANVRLPKLISNGMVLERNVKVNIWGWADPSEKIVITLDGKNYSIIANDKGDWKLVLPPHQAGGPFIMTITAKNRLQINNILFGDIWLCSGQSNMELPVSRVKTLYESEIRKANNPNIRSFTVPQKYNFKSSEIDFDGGSWQEVNPVSVLDFSAAAYFFANELYTKYKVPIGLINSSLGGSPAQAWISEEGLKSFPNYLNEAYKWRDDDLIRDTEALDRNISKTWYAEADHNDAGHQLQNWKSAELNDSNWISMNVPGYWYETPIGNVNGVVWFRKEFNISKENSGKTAFLNLSRIVDADSVFINGKFIGNTTYQYPPRWYNVPANVLIEGKNVIVVRVVNNSGKGGFVLDKPYELTVGNKIIDLKGVWKIKLGYKISALPSQTFIRWKPMGLYNAMIAPLLNYNIKGAIWYQGESNTGDSKEYSSLLSTLINDWRSHFRQKNLPFLYVQLPNFMEAKLQPSESNWALLRESQLKTLSVPKTGMAVTIDAGEWNDIHPLNKKIIGQRLAKLAEQIVYKNKKVFASAPQYKSMKIVGNTIELTFSKSANLLTSIEKKDLNCFAIAGADKKFVWAKAEIKGNKIVVWNDNIQQPIAVRYAWADNPNGANLIDTEGNFVSPFRTDSW